MPSKIHRLTPSASKCAQSETMRIYHECEGGIKGIHHRCSEGTGKSQPEGPPFQWEIWLAEFPTEWWTRGFRFFLEPLNSKV